jgi:hypothetical protein
VIAEFTQPDATYSEDRSTTKEKNRVALEAIALPAALAA